MNLRTLALSASILILSGGVANAQPMPPPGAHAGPHGAMDHADPAAMAKRHADKLRATLQLTAAQEPALAALMASMQPPEGGMAKMRADRQAMDGLSTPQRLDQMLAKMDERRAAMAQHVAAVKRFYAQLTPSQQKAFDAMHQGHERPMGGAMGAHRMKDHMGPGRAG
jgi:periplasmic protein CpxP/Spy